ncbi:GIY-YIG nuclease family protein [Pseudoroseicyclus aestuarii]|uniref:Uncharacterized protein n=1 Tax=Pseudoroseicyclus aestuarii TaxID=1795041 RepID=A0A318SMZ7_9RHOB|nr:GIY-YIG nuclease family protein [Pseudoroseicyclus aestuarii]PYE82204.1 hypothetical protein DFP88_10544 [Pseudoroseicyclus aestuarii]
MMDHCTPAPSVEPGFDAPIRPHWAELAHAKGFRIARRIRDRSWLELECRTCRGLTPMRLWVLTSAQPHCRPCMEARWRKTAQAAGLTFLRRCPDHRHYAHYRAPCGHEVRRQFAFVERMARSETDALCRICMEARDAAEAEQRGWRLLGPDPRGTSHYRLYAHEDGCGAEQRIARANMQTGRFSCGTCGEDWPAAPSALYLMRLDLPGLGRVVKLGYSRDPWSRMTYQLGIGGQGRAELLAVVPMPTGREAYNREQALHARLKTEIPQHIVPRAELEGVIRVVSEIYRAEAEPRILGLLDDLADGVLDDEAADHAPVAETGRDS